MNNRWQPERPVSMDLGDHDVPLSGTHLKGKRIALMITGSIASMKAATIARSLRRYGADVVVYASDEAMRYTTLEALEWSTLNRVVTRLTSAAEHLCDSTPFDVYLLAPATYNSINKFRYGVADGVITTTLASALGRMELGQAKILVAPTMHGTMHNAILTESINYLQDLGVWFIPPREDYGKHNIPATRNIVAAVCRAVSASPLKGVKILVTGGPTPVPVDDVRRLTNRFRGRLGIKIAEELCLRGGDVRLILGDGAIRPADFVSYRVARTYDEYYKMVMDSLNEEDFFFGVYSAAVADYRPKTKATGKLPSGGTLQRIELISTVKVIDDVKNAFPDHYAMTFKYQENLSHDELMQIARNRLDKGYPVVVANRGEEKGPAGEQVAWLVVKDQPEKKLLSKQGIAEGVADHLESIMNQRLKA